MVEYGLDVGSYGGVWPRLSVARHIICHQSGKFRKKWQLVEDLSVLTFRGSGASKNPDPGLAIRDSKLLRRQSAQSRKDEDRAISAGGGNEYSDRAEGPRT